MNRRIVNVLRVFRIAFFWLLGVELDDFRKADNGIKRRSQLVRHIRKEFCLSAIGSLRFQHLLVGQISSGFGILLGIDESQARDRPVEQRAELGTISRQQRFAFASSAVAHHSSFQPSPVR